MCVSGFYLFRNSGSGRLVRLVSSSPHARTLLTRRKPGCFISSGLDWCAQVNVRHWLAYKPVSIRNSVLVLKAAVPHLSRCRALPALLSVGSGGQRTAWTMTSPRVISTAPSPMPDVGTASGSDPLSLARTLIPTHGCDTARWPACSWR